MSCVISYCSFYFLIFLCFLVGAIVCVYVCIQLYCSCCHYGVIKHDDDDDDDTAQWWLSVRVLDLRLTCSGFNTRPMAFA